MKLVLAAMTAAIIGMLTLPSTADAGSRRWDGGVIPCSRDDYSFRHGRWMSNCRSGYRGGDYAAPCGGRCGGGAQFTTRSRNVEVQQYHRRTYFVIENRWRRVNGVCVMGRCPPY